MRSRRSIRAAMGTGAGLLLAVATVLAVHRLRKAVPASPSSVPAASAAGPRRVDAVPPGTETPTGEVRVRADIRALRDTRDPAKGAAIVRQVMLTLRSMPASEAAGLVRALLLERVDAPTFLRFRLGPGGSLEAASSLRVYLLDLLERLDSEAAAGAARTALSAMESPEEWAMALRILSRASSSASDRALLEDRLRAMLDHEPWKRDPADAFLECFDAFVALGGGRFVVDLARLAADRSHEPVAHAARLALDRLAAREPDAVTGPITRSLARTAGLGDWRATCLARADVGDPGQRRDLETYLLDPTVSASELDAFAGSFPNENLSAGDFLVTSVPVRSGDAIRKRDVVALHVVEAWLRDPRFAGRRPVLATIQSRLRTFLNLPRAPDADPDQGTSTAR